MIKRLQNEDAKEMTGLLSLPEQAVYFEAFFGRQNDVYYECFADLSNQIVLQRVFSVWHLNCPCETDPEEALAFLSMHGAREISTCPQTAEKIRALAPGFEAERYPLLKYCSAQRHDPYGKAVKTMEEHKKVYRLLTESGLLSLTSFEEYYTARRSVEKIGAGASYALYEGGIAVSTASILCESSDKAMLGAVATAQGHRGKGHAGRLVGAVADSLAKAGREVYIACLNPEALAVYRRIGFEDFSHKTVLKMQKNAI